jgi:nucleoside-diphosphate-sugar epimerase/predicted dehydrogenase
MKYFILGGGSVTTEYYLPALRLLGHLRDVTVVDPDADKIEALRDFDGVSLRVLDYATFLRTLPSTQNDPGRIIVALPNRLHVDAASLALIGRRHVLCEKPLALTASDCAKVRALAATTQCLVKVGMSRRYIPSLMLAREIVARKELGAVRAIEVHDCTTFGWRPRSFAFFAVEAGGILADIGVHYLDYLETLVGPLQPVGYSDDARGGSESTLHYRLSGGGDISIDMRLSRIHRSEGFIKIACEGGDIRIDRSRHNEIAVTPTHSMTRRLSAENPFDASSWPSSLVGGFCQMLTDFERAIDGRASAIADVSDAERTAALIEWAYERRAATGVVPPQATVASARTKVLVTGGTGFIGGHLLERLCKDGLDVRVAARTPGKCANVARFPVELAAVNLLDDASLRSAVSGARIVYHLAYGKDGKNRAEITVDGTKRVVEAAIAARAECVVVLSTINVFGFPEQDRAVDESSGYRPYGVYGKSKAKMERWCLSRARSSLPTRIVVLNPTCVFGPGGNAYTNIPVDLACEGQFCWIDGGTGYCNYNYVENLVDAILAAARVKAAHGNRFIINDGVVSWRELLEPMLRPFINDDLPSYTAAELKNLPRYGKPFSILDLIRAATAASEVRQVARRSRTLRVLSARARAMHTARGVVNSHPRPQTAVGRNSKFPPETLGNLYVNTRTSFSAKKANEMLRWQPAVGLPTALQRTIDWLVATRRGLSGC